MPNICSLCGQSLDAYSQALGYSHHISSANVARIPLWDSCIRACRGDSERLLTVHRVMAESEPLLARAYAGDS